MLTTIECDYIKNRIKAIEAGRDKYINHTKSDYIVVQYSKAANIYWKYTYKDVINELKCILDKFEN